MFRENLEAYRNEDDSAENFRAAGRNLLSNGLSDVRTDFRRHQRDNSDNNGRPDDFVPDKSKRKSHGKRVKARSDSESGQRFKPELF